MQRDGMANNLNKTTNKISLGAAVAAFALGAPLTVERLSETLHAVARSSGAAGVAVLAEAASAALIGTVIVAFIIKDAASTLLRKG